MKFDKAIIYQEENQVEYLRIGDKIEIKVCDVILGNRTHLGVIKGMELDRNTNRIKLDCSRDFESDIVTIKLDDITDVKVL
ncbi:MAG: hypothetical protein RR359_02890 [Bacilli bacterium]